MFIFNLCEKGMFCSKKDDPDFFSLSYSNIFVTAPSPENLKTLFEFIFKGFDALDYQVLFVYVS